MSRPASAALRQVIDEHLLARRQVRRSRRRTTARRPHRRRVRGGTGGPVLRAHRSTLLQVVGHVDVPSELRLDAAPCSAACAAARRARGRSSRGACVNPRSHRMISSASAWADIESMRSMRAATGTNCAVDLDRRRRPRAAAGRACRRPGSPTKSTVLRGSGSAAFRWCSTRPPVAIPLAEMTIAGRGARPGSPATAAATRRP